ncbi:hypothetical protein [Catellatospora vulcania]|uniref:hypothetical protein n=1 Tax=Catellatospora vulcania TaxID=1460450 RepID=UPI0012D48D70|nr:hypothetical protein [Catellatospora vulcania]
MGIEAKISNVSRRCAGRSMELIGKLTHSTRWQLTGYTTWVSACEDAAREQAKDLAKAMEAVAAYRAGGAAPSGRGTTLLGAPASAGERFLIDSRPALAATDVQPTGGA